MPHSTLRLSGGTVTNETPTLNSAGIASCNRIRFKYDPQGLTLVEKLGGWSQFWVTKITSGVVRALWAWQDTAGVRWLAWGADSSTPTTNTILGAVSCTTDPSTGITTGTVGGAHNLTPTALASMARVDVVVNNANANLFVVVDPNLTGFLQTNGNIYSVFITNPIAVGGVVLQGQYALQSVASSSAVLVAVDILGNPLNALFSTNGPSAITSAGFVSGTPNTIVLHFTGPYTYAVNDFVNVHDSTNTISGTYQVVASSTTSVTIKTTLGSYTLSGTVTIDNFGTTPIFTNTNGTQVINYFLPNHNLKVGDPIYVLNPTVLASNVIIQGTFTVASVVDSANVTFIGPSALLGVASSHQWQGAIPITTGTANGTSITVNFPSLYATNANNPYATGVSYLFQGISPSGWNGTFTLTSFPTTTSATYTNSSSAGAGGQGSFSPIGGVAVNVYSVAGNPTGPPTPTGSGTFWTLDNWGNDLIAVPGSNPVIAYPAQPLLYQPVYFWDSTSTITAQAIAAGPTASLGAFVAMPERQIVAWGSTFSGILDPLLIRWCDINNFNTWTAQITNQAGSFRLPSGSTIIGARQTTQQALIWTDIEVWAMQYINQPYVYSFNKIGQGCGLIGKYAHGILGGVTYWMSKTQIFMLSGDGVVSVPCPIWDVVFQDLDLANVGKITCATNSMFQEVTWYFPVKSGNGENSQYIKLNVSGMSSGQAPLWDYGTLDRSAWIDVSILQQPIGYSPLNQWVYQHEIATDDDSHAMGESFTTGWFSVADGDQMAFVDQVWPDFKLGYYAQAQTGQVNITINGQDFPSQSSPQSVGPYTVTQSSTWFSPRMRHRLVSFTVGAVPSNTGTWWRIGGVRYRWQPDGRF